LYDNFRIKTELKKAKFKIHSTGLRHYCTLHMSLLNLLELSMGPCEKTKYKVYQELQNMSYVAISTICKTYQTHGIAHMLSISVS